MIEKTYVVHSKIGNFSFHGVFTQPDSPGKFELDPLSFYQQWGKSIPDTPHFEIEIAAPRSAFFDEHTLHVHRSRFDTSRLFVCYPKRIATIEEADRIFRVWCLGSVLTIAEKIDLNTIFKECDNDAAKMEQVLRDRHSIFIVEQSPAST